MIDIQLGKENIVEHAASKHGGRGAYQCQFCKKVNFYVKTEILVIYSIARFKRN